MAGRVMLAGEGAQAAGVGMCCCVLWQTAAEQSNGLVGTAGQLLERPKCLKNRGLEIRKIQSSNAAVPIGIVYFVFLNELHSAPVAKRVWCQVLCHPVEVRWCVSVAQCSDGSQQARGVYSKQLVVGGLTWRQVIAHICGRPQQ
jgi:hypothetical protein